MNMRTALKIAKSIGGAEFKKHYGRTKRDRAVRIYGCFPEQAKEVARQLEAAGFPPGNFRLNPGSALYWLD